MKTIEEKARAYDSIIEKANKMHSENCEACKACIEELIPELKESEDEKVRKEIIDFLKLPHPQFVGKRDHEKWIAWLEKQESVDEIVSRCKNSWYNEGKIAGMAEGLTNDEKYQQGWHDALEKQGELAKDILEDAILDGNEDGLIAETIRYKHEKQSKQKLDKVEPKFKVGDWIINPRTGLIKHIKNVLLCDNNGNYEFESSSMSIDSVDNSFHLWTIQDAKDGDILTFKNNICGIIICKFPTDYDTRSYCRFVSDNFINKEESGWDSTLLVPATKEQRALLFQKMKEAGYTFDFERKKLEKIKPKTEENKGNVGGISPNWSEEDERNLQGIIDEIEANKNQAPDYDLATYDRFLSWLKSLKGRVQPKQEWSEEEIEPIISDYLCGREHYGGMIGRLCHLKPKQKQTEWSENDKAFLDDILCKLEHDLILNKDEKDWLKSLRSQNTYNPYKAVVDSIAAMVEKYAPFDSNLQDFYDNVKVKCKDAKEYDKMFPQTQWKPSDEQIECLSDAIEHYNSLGYPASKLKELLNDLKKLKKG